MFITIGDCCYKIDQIKCFGIDTNRMDDYITVELTNGDIDEIEFDSHKIALKNFHHALAQLNLMTHNQTKETQNSDK